MPRVSTCLIVAAHAVNLQPSQCSRSKCERYGVSWCFSLAIGASVLCQAVLFLSATFAISAVAADEVSAETNPEKSNQKGSPQIASPFDNIPVDKLAVDTQFVSLAIDNGQPGTESSLFGRDARVQLIVTATDSDNRLHDWTHEVNYSVDPTGLVQIDSEGLVTPLADGEVTISAEALGLSATTKIEVVGLGESRPISFASQIVPIFTKLGCNGGGCHGKIAGQNGFKLSLLGFEPREDYDRLVRESRGRRVFPAAPDHSLVLRKAINASPHGGGQRMDKESHEYRLLRRWISQGMPYGTGNEPKVAAIDVYPSQRRLGAGETQQLSVVATYTDGSTEDATRATVYQSNDAEMCKVSTTGRVKLGSLVGDVAVMARYQGHVTVFRADIPLDAHDDSGSLAWPAVRNLVDRYVFGKLRSLRIPASATCDDATFLRRVTLDITGRLPTLREIQDFESDTREDKRDRLVDRLLDSDDYAEYFAGKWNAILRNRRAGTGLSFGTVAFHAWIRESLAQNMPYDQFVREILTASGSVASNPPVVWYHQVSDTNQRLEDAAQLFLGQRIQCARCHHHPFEKWSQKDYAQMAAFFSLVSRKTGADPDEPRFVSKFGVATAKHPKNGQTLRPAGLDGDVLSVGEAEDPRTHLVDWMVQENNPFFAKALVNRYWKHFAGRGLVEPEDDLRITNPPSNPELLEGLADWFAQSDYDLKGLIRLVCQSNTFALASEPREPNLVDRRSYSRFYPKRFSAEVLLDAVDRVTASPSKFQGVPAGTRAVSLPDTGFDSYFLNVFGRPRSTTACECERSQEANLAQSLHLLNSEQIQKKLSDPNGRAAKLSADKSRNDEAKVRELYRVALCRSPRQDELRNVLSYLESQPNRHEGYEDVIWSLINSKEFMFNH